MKISCIIVDDEELGRELIAEYLEPFSNIELLTFCVNGQEAIQKIDQLQPDLVFLDVQMPGITGFEVLERITHCPFVIFATAYDSYALKAFEENAIDYLLKPIKQSRFNLAIQRAMERIKQSESNIEQVASVLQDKQQPATYPARLFVKKSGKMVALKVEQITCIEASGNYSVLSSGGEQFLSNTSISKLEEKLNPEQFMRIHRSTLINIDCIREIEKEADGGLVVVLDNKKSFPVSRNYVQQIRDLMI